MSKSIKPKDCNYVYLFFKIGDAANGIKHCQPICFIDPDDYKVEDYSSTLSYNMKKVFLCCKISKSNLNFVRSLFTNGVSNKRINLNAISNRFNLDYDLNLKLLSNDIVEPFDISENVETFFSNNTNSHHINDNNAISSGDFTIGASGDYATLALFAADLSDLTNDLNGWLISDVIESGVSNVGINLNNYTLSIQSLSSCKISINHNSYGVIYSCTNGNFTLDRLCFNRTLAASGRGVSLILVNSSSGAGLFNIRNNVLDNNNLEGCGFRSAGSSPTIYLYNNLVLDCSISDREAFLLDSSDGNANSIYENNSFYNCDVGFRVNGNSGNFLNNASFCASACFENISNAVGNNNASSDASAADGNWSNGSGNLTSLAAANEFRSLVSTESDFLLPINGQNLNSGGTNPLILAHVAYQNNNHIISGDVDVGAKGLSRGSIGTLFGVNINNSIGVAV